MRKDIHREQSRGALSTGRGMKQWAFRNSDRGLVDL